MAVSIYQHKEHLSILRKLSAEEILDLFKNIPAIINRKNKMRVKSGNFSENVIDAFVFLLAESSYVNESEFCDSLKSNGFSNEQVSKICDCACNKMPLYVSIFQNSRSRFLRFKDLEWRLEAKISSRSALHEFNPSVCIKLNLAEGKNRAAKSNIAEKKKSIHCSENTKQLIMNLDLNRIRHIINVLEEALIIMKAKN